MADSCTDSQTCNMLSAKCKGTEEHLDRTLMQLRSAEAAGLAAALKTIPGLSSSLMFLSRCTSWTEVVTPGALPTAATRVRFKLLIRLLLPTFGSPMMPAHLQIYRQWMVKFVCFLTSVHACKVRHYLDGH